MSVRTDRNRLSTCVTVGMGNHDRRSEFAKHWPEAAARLRIWCMYNEALPTERLNYASSP